jgi:oligopeptide transport system substrate-binding protein
VRRVLATLMFAALCLSVTACGRSAPVRQPCPADKVCLELGNDAEPVSLDPHKITGTWEDRVVGDLFVGLTQADPQGRPVPGMATSWETTPDGLIWTFHLRDAKWSDGVPVTADDFVFALQRLMDPKTASEYASLLYFIQNAEAVNAGKAPLRALGVRAIDPHTLRIVLIHPAPYLPQLTMHMTMYPVPKHVVQRWGDAWSDPAHYVGNGAYKLVSWRLGDHIHVVKNPLFWDADKVCVDEVNYYPTTDPVAAERRVKRGELDANGSIQANRVAFLRQPGQMPDYVKVHTYLGTSYFAFNTRDVAAFKDRRVRIALAMSIDREFIADKLQHGVTKPAFTFVPPGVANYRSPPPPVWASWPIERRQRAAKVLLAQAGYGPSHPLKVELKHSNTPGALQVMPSIQADWRSIGVTTTLAQEEPAIAYQDYRVRNFQIASAGWIADYNDAMSFLYLQQSSTGTQNYGDYSNPTYDALLDRADHEPDVVKRAADLAQAERIMLSDSPVTPTVFAVNTDLVNPQITGWVDNIVDQHRTRYLCLKGHKAPAG